MNTNKLMHSHMYRISKNSSPKHYLLQLSAWKIFCPRCTEICWATSYRLSPVLTCFMKRTQEIVCIFFMPTARKDKRLNLQLEKPQKCRNKWHSIIHYIYFLCLTVYIRNSMLANIGMLSLSWQTLEKFSSIILHTKLMNKTKINVNTAAPILKVIYIWLS